MGDRLLDWVYKENTLVEKAEKLGRNGGEMRVALVNPCVASGQLGVTSCSPDLNASRCVFGDCWEGVIDSVIKTKIF